MPDDHSKKPTKKKLVQLYLEPELHVELERIAHEENRKIAHQATSFVIDALRIYRALNAEDQSKIMLIKQLLAETIVKLNSSVESNAQASM